MSDQQSWDNYFMGMVIEWPVSFSIKDMQRFAILSGDYNPIHIDSSFAKAKGFDAPLVYGLLLSSQMSRLIGQQLPDKNAILTSIQMDFLKPGFPNDQLIFKACLTNKSESVFALEFKCEILRGDATLCRGVVGAIWRP